MCKIHDYEDIKGCQLSYINKTRFSIPVYIYILDDLLIDTGPSNMEKIVSNIYCDYNLKSVVLTHYHEDHSGNVLFLQNNFNIEIMAHSLTNKILNSIKTSIVSDSSLCFDIKKIKIKPLPEVIKTKSFSLFPIYTPGHSIDHMVYIETNRGWLFSGDIYLVDRIKFFHLDENIKEYVDSLKKILLYDFDKIFCSHNPVFKNGKNRIRNKLDYFENFIGRVLTYYQSGMTENEIVNYLDKGRDLKMKIMSNGDLSYANMIRSAIRSI